MTDTAVSAADYAHMARALQLARRGEFSAAPNPSVGCVLLDSQGNVVGEGWHRRAGEPHAEIHALAEAGGRARAGTAYVTLEPCSHHGRTPPCVDAVLAAGLQRVVVAAMDPNPRVAGGGLRKRETAGIDVTVGVLDRDARELNRGFFARMTRRTPWVTVKVGASIDGRTALASGESKWITSEVARVDAQRLRARASVVLPGIGTVLADDPSLTVRDPQLSMHGRQPLRVVFDTAGRINSECRLLNDGNQTLVFVAEGTASAGGTSTTQVLEQDKVHVRVESLPVKQGGLDVQAALARLAELECNEVLVEAGPRLAGAFVAGGHADEIVVYLAATILGGYSRPMFALPEPLQSLAARQSYAFHDVRQVGEDLRLTLRPKGN